MNKALGLVGTSFGLIALYLILAYGTNAATIARALGDSYVGVVRALQAR